MRTVLLSICLSFILYRGMNLSYLTSFHDEVLIRENYEYVRFIITLSIMTRHDQNNLSPIHFAGGPCRRRHIRT